jgi:hypothetical protein
MKPVEFKSYNAMYHASDKENNPVFNYDHYIDKLPVMNIEGKHGQHITCWELNEEDLEEIKRTGKIYLSQLTMNNPLQPSMLGTSLADIELVD